MQDEPQVMASATRAGVRAGQHKPLGIQRHAGSGKPIRIWIGADE